MYFFNYFLKRSEFLIIINLIENNIILTHNIYVWDISKCDFQVKGHWENSQKNQSEI